jgi:hypothetical protein
MVAASIWQRQYGKPILKLKAHQEKQITQESKEQDTPESSPDPQTPLKHWPWIIEFPHHDRNYPPLKLIPFQTYTTGPLFFIGTICTTVPLFDQFFKWINFRKLLDKLNHFKIGGLNSCSTGFTTHSTEAHR